MTLYKLLATACLTTMLGSMSAQNKADQIYIDDNGIMRWTADRTELHGFGVNYTLPFAHEYRMAQRAGVPHEEAIKQDVYHMARLDMDLYRVHVWDTEISDTLGNLIDNDHLRLFDFAVNEMKQRGMRFVITPIAFWGNGWPEPDTQSPGFSHKYGKGNCLTNAAAIEAQAKYLNQLLSHINPYTGIAYKDEPNVIAFEISNEPHNGGAANEVTAYINKMVASMRQTGCTKPIFYNMSHSIHLVDAYLNADIQGGTFQWYPTNLVANQQINGNYLPHVAQYKIPFADHPKFKKMAKIVYEFDPADVGGNILYPAMARSFREAGMQLATQFAYDAMCWAPYNTNYGTHFMNLAYAPNKAISLKIASAVFHRLPLYQKQGTEKSKADASRISYTENLTEWVTNDRFFYSNNTASQPLDAAQLKEIAGCGSSPLVDYSGTGAYFLDKLADGVWRLEVMPDAYWIDDPYGKATPRQQKAAVLHAQRQMTVKLANLGSDFNVTPINNGNTFQPQVTNGQFQLMPGVYLLKRNGTKQTIAPTMVYKNIKINEYVAPASNLGKTVLWNHAPAETVAGQPLRLDFQTVAPLPIRKVSVVMSIGDKWKTLPAVPNGANGYTVEVPSDMLTVGLLNYRIMVEDEQGITRFPGGEAGDPWSWENGNAVTYTVRLLPAPSQLELWNAATDWEATHKIWNRAINLQPTADGATVLAIRLPQLPNEDPLQKENRNYAFKFYFGDKTKGRKNELSLKKSLVVKASNLLPTAQPVEIGLIDKNGSVLSGVLAIDPNSSTCKIALNTFANAPFLIIPRPYPDFLPYSVQTNGQPFDWSSIEVLQVMVKPGSQANVDLNIEKIWLE